MQKPHTGPAQSEQAIRVRALESILTEKGLISTAALDALVDTYETQDRAAQWRQGGGTRLGRSGV